VLFADPLAKLYHPARWGGGSDPNAAYTQWFTVLEDIVRCAKLRLVFLAHHTGFSEEAADRSRGASAMMDNPTVNMAYRHNGDHAGKPLGNQRYLKTATAKSDLAGCRSCQVGGDIQQSTATTIVDDVTDAACTDTTTPPGRARRTRAGQRPGPRKGNL
jgi:hypothetical protein